MTGNQVSIQVKIMRLGISLAAFVLLFLLARRDGGRPERLAAELYGVVILVGLVYRTLAGAQIFLGFEVVPFLMEFALLAGLFLLAIRANRFWPIIVTGMQTLVVCTHVTKAIGIKGMAGVYWGMTTIPTYLEYLILLAGILNHTRRVAQLGQYPDWRIQQA